MGKIMKHSRAREIICVVFRHNWTESGSKTCTKHNHEYGKYVTCGRCGLTKTTGDKLCGVCWIEFCIALRNGDPERNVCAGVVAKSSNTPVWPLTGLSGTGNGIVKGE